MTGVIPSTVVTRIRILVRDVAAATEKWSQFLGVEPVIGPVAAGKGPAMDVRFHGVPAPEAEITCSLFQVGPDNFIELMQPNDKPSVWREALDSTGEGLHSISFDVTDMSEAISMCTDFGAKVLQTGVFETGDGRYAYLDLTKSLKSVIELEQTDVPLREILSAGTGDASQAGNESHDV